MLAGFVDGSEVLSVLVRNSSQSSPLLRMKLVISRKTWYDTGMFWYEGGDSVDV